MYNVIGRDRKTGKEIMIEPHMTEANAVKFCEMWGWFYDDGKRSYAMLIEKEE